MIPAQSRRQVKLEPAVKHTRKFGGKGWRCLGQKMRNPRPRKSR